MSSSSTTLLKYTFKIALKLKPSVGVTIHDSTDQRQEFEAKMKENMPTTSVVIAEPKVTTIVTPKRANGKLIVIHRLWKKLRQRANYKFHSYATDFVR